MDHRKIDLLPSWNLQLFVVSDPHCSSHRGAPAQASATKHTVCPATNNRLQVKIHQPIAAVLGLSRARRPGVRSLGGFRLG